MSNEDIVRAVAALAAVGIVGGPAASRVASAAKAWWGSKPAMPSTGTDSGKAEASRLADMRIVLELAARLKADGCPDGVALCQQLLDVMLTGSKAKK